jgi:hypothetical protein
MKAIIVIALLLCCTVTVMANKEKKWATPLSKYSKEWDNPKYKKCNTAAMVRYLTDDEKEIVFVLNMARMNPQLFCRSVLIKERLMMSCDTGNYYYKSLIETLTKMKPAGLLRPDSLCYVSAKCHVVTSGSTHYAGHDRQTEECRKKTHFSGECCQYGLSDPVYIVLSLLVDKDIESLGHRRTCLNDRYTLMSPAMGPHKGYQVMTVMDFDYKNSFHIH